MNMSAQTEKKTERKSVPPSERKSKPPIGVNTSKLQGTFGSSVIEGIMDVSGQVAEAKISSAKKEIEKAVGEVEGKADSTERKRKVLRNKMEKAEKSLRELEKTLKEVEKSATVAEGLESGNSYVISEIRETLAGTGMDVVTAYSDLDELNAFMDEVFDDVEDLYAKMGKQREFNEKVCEAYNNMKKQFGKALAMEISERRKEVKELKEENEGLVAELREMRKELEETKKLADDAMHDSEVARAAASGALEAVTSIQRTANGISSNVHKMGKEVERLSMAPSVKPETAESYVGEAKGIAKMPPAPVALGGHSKKIKKLNLTVPEMIQANAEKFGEHASEITKLNDITEVLIEQVGIDLIKEPREVGKIDITEYKGYDSLGVAMKKMFEDSARQVNEARSQDSMLDSLYEATSRLVREQTGEEMKMPARPAKVALEETETLGNGEAQVLRKTVEGVAKELDKQYYKIRMIEDGLEKVLGHLEGDGE